jgi:phosphomannomutase
MKIHIPASVFALKDKLYKSTAYDIRAYVGEIGDFFSEKAVMTPLAMEITGALMATVPFTTQNGSIVQLLPGDSVVVGYDNGPTSKALAEAFAKGLTGQGVNVYDIGVASSGQVYHNQTQLNAQGHVQITRSHVEVTTNGAKFGIGQQGIHTFLLKQMNDYITHHKTIGRECQEGRVIDKSQEGYELYCDKMIGRYGEYFKANPRKLAVNLFGGTGLQYKHLFQEIFGDGLTILGDTIDVNAGTLLADPTRKEMLERVPDLHETLAKGVRVHSFDLDADRGSVTEGANALAIGESGHYLGDDLSYILADYKLSTAVPALFSKLGSAGLIDKESLDAIHQSAITVIVDPRYTSGVTSFVDKRGGRTVYHRKGHSLWKETMSASIREMAVMAGFANVDEFLKATSYQDIQVEASLHLFSTDPEDGIPRDDAIENVFLLERIFDKLNITSLRDYFKDIPKRYATKEIRTNSVSNEAKDKITEYILNFIKHTFRGEKYQVIEFDGQIRAEWATGFIMYGMSNTSPKLTFMAEGTTPEERNEALAYILALHNETKAKFNDDLKMDVSENPFFVNDPSYAMPNPDDVTMAEARAAKFAGGL